MGGCVLLEEGLAIGREGEEAVGPYGRPTCSCFELFAGSVGVSSENVNDFKGEIPWSFTMMKEWLRVRFLGVPVGSISLPRLRVGVFEFASSRAAIAGFGISGGD